MCVYIYTCVCVCDWFLKAFKCLYLRHLWFILFVSHNMYNSMCNQFYTAHFFTMSSLLFVVFVMLKRLLLASYAIFFYLFFFSKSLVKISIGLFMHVTVEHLFVLPMTSFFWVIVSVYFVRNRQSESVVTRSFTCVRVFCLFTHEATPPVLIIVK